MQPQANLDMSIIREALARRQAGGLGGGSSIPAGGQTTSGMPSPMGAPATQQPGSLQPGTPNLAQLPTQVRQTGGQPGNEQLRAGQQAQGPSFDPETRDLAKSLVQRLLKGL